MSSTVDEVNSVFTPFIAGGCTGLFVDILLFPLDTLTTRLQSFQGFQKAGGFRHLYKGIGPTLIGSTPQAALFFLTYEHFKITFEPLVPIKFIPGVHICAASLGELVCCLIRTPVEVIKQRRQTSQHNAIHILIDAYKKEGIRKGVYRGFLSTAMVEMPYAMIQLPLIEYLKNSIKHYKNTNHLNIWEIGFCGALAGATSATFTTPLDVIKTRIMLAEMSKKKRYTWRYMFNAVYKEKGFQGLFLGYTPRTTWCTIDGFLFYPIYEIAKHLYVKYFVHHSDK